MSDSFETAAPASKAIRTLPASTDAEALLLSCCLLDGNDVVAKCIMASIAPESFYETKHALLFATILSLYGRQKPISVSIVVEELKTSRQLEEIGGYSFLVEVSSLTPTTAQLGYFIEKVKEQATLRALIRSRSATVEQCYNFSGGMDEFLTEVVAKEAKAVDIRDDGEEAIQTEANRLYVELTLPREQRNKAPVREISWGLLDIDRSCGALAPGTLNILAGMPSTGKSALADQMAWNAASKGKNVVVFTYEMTKREKAVRIAQQVSRLNLDKFDEAPTNRQRQFTDALQKINACKTLHVFERDISMNRLTARARAISARTPVEFIVVDFLQYLARMEAAIGRESTNEKIGRMTAALKNVGKECNCPVLLLSSLNRDGYKDGNRPTLASLRSSGEIESDADVVAILHWPKEKTTGEEQDPHDPLANTFEVEFNQDKGRSKGVHQVILSFDRQATRFDNYKKTEPGYLPIHPDEPEELIERQAREGR